MMLSRVSCVLEPGLLFGSIIAKDCSKLELGRLVEEVKQCEMLTMFLILLLEFAE